MENAETYTYYNWYADMDRYIWELSVKEMDGLGFSALVGHC